MNTARHLILNNGRDITSDVKFCKYNTSTGKYDVTFQNDQTYHYNYQSIQWIRDPENLNPALVRIMHGGREFFKIQEISVFHAPAAEYWNICFSDGSKKTYNRRDLDVKFSCLDEEEAGSCISYLRRIAAINELKNDDGDVLLQKQYEKLAFVGGDTAMAVYLNPSGHKIRTYRKDSFIFPFGGNASQFQAVQNAGRSQISVIQGPPGTGKTQTILNIIANLLLEGKTVQIVSNNNSATENVLEKLSSPKYNMDFLVAPLGKAENKKAFVQSQTGFYPDLSTWEMESEKQEELLSRINAAAAELSESFAKQERLALLRQEMDSLLLEMQYFDQYCKETGLVCSEIMPRHRLKSETLMGLWQECYGFSEKDRAVSFWFKIKSAFIYGISNWRYYSRSLTSIITLLQNLFYQAKKSELEDETGSLETYLKSVDAKGKMDRLTADSMDYLRAKLFDRFGGQTERKIFSEDDL